MRRMIAVMAAATALTVGACNSPQWPTQRREVMNAWTVNEYQRDSIEAAIVSQHTLYPYHFVRNGAELNELGARDLSVLAEHYRENPGTLNLRRAGTAAGLYKARLTTVTTLLVEHGVDTDRVTIGDGPAGGDGIASERVLIILEEKMDEPLTPDSNGLSSFSGS